MPVRIYELAKRLGIESKEVLTFAKEMGIAARVASSSLDKITAEYLEGEIRTKLHIPLPEPAVAPPPEPTAEAPAPVEPPIPEVIQTQAPPAAVPEIAPLPTEAVGPPPVPPAPPPEPEVVIPKPPIVPVATTEAAALPVEAAPVEAPPPAPEVAEAQPVAVPEAPPPPPEPPKPGIGDLVGRIELKPRPAARFGDRGGAKTPLRPSTAFKTEFVPARPGQRGPRATPELTRAQARQVRPGAAAKSPAPAPATRYAVPEGAEVITMKAPIAVRDLAERLGKRPFEVIAVLMNELKVFANVNQTIEETVAQKICARFGYRFEVEKRERRGRALPVVIKQVELDPEDRSEDMRPRAPVVTIMGHVDHGKTSLLDVIRKSNVVAGEAGGITQHIGAYTISVPHPERKGEMQQITFLDTPGHAAFSAMRARGANVTDIVILVVAANDGVMPQTLEALNHAMAAKVPMMVAVNKCDHPAASPMKVRQQLQDKGLVPDEWGGNTFFVDVSALTQQGIDKLLEMICFQADLMELKANPNRRAKGHVIESGLEPGGPTATVLVRKGTLRQGDVVLCGPHWGKVRALTNEEDKRLKEAGPSVAVKLLGLNGVPEAGLEFTVVENDKAAREIAAQRAEEARREQINEPRAQVTIEDILQRTSKTDEKVLKLVVKADTQGSVEAIVDALKKIESAKVVPDIIHSAVGTITENDVMLASGSKAVVLGFHTRIDSGVSDLAKREGVQIKLYTIIYELIDEVKLAMAGKLEPILKELVTGVAEVRKVFELSKGGNVAGSMVTSGRINRGKVRVQRRRNLIYEGQILSLRRFQDEVNEVRAGMECGIRIDGFDEFQPGDTVECYTIERVAQKL